MEKMKARSANVPATPTELADMFMLIVSVTLLTGLPGRHNTYSDFQMTFVALW